jgi:multicomponent K+:H+ antiporter subunit E
MRRLLPEPRLSAALFVGWLMLNGSTSAGNLVLGAVLGWVLPWATQSWRPDRPRIARWRPIVRLAGIVLVDIVVSNIAVARRILGPERNITPRFVRVPLSIRDPHGLVALAGIVTMTPGTLSADLSDDGRELLVHAFDVDDADEEAALLRSIRERYEAPLISIFEGDAA